MAALTADSLRAYVGAKPADADYVASCWGQAVALVNNFLGAGVTSAPSEIVERAYLECGSELFHRRQAPNGVAQFAAADGAPVRVARDPMLGVYPLLTPYVVGIG